MQPVKVAKYEQILVYITVATLSLVYKIKSRFFSRSLPVLWVTCGETGRFFLHQQIRTRIGELTIHVCM